MGYVKSFSTGLLLAFALLLGSAAPARAADKVRITGLQTANFGQLSGFGDRSISQNVCAYSSSATNGYSVTATGSGTGGSFALTSTITELPYEVLWSDSSGQTSGTSLMSGTRTGGFFTSAAQHFCNSGPSSTASLTIVIRSTTIESARAGTYSGVLQIMIAPE